MLEILKILAMLLTLLWASAQDIRTRSVINPTWPPVALIAFSIDLLELNDQYFNLPLNWFLGFALVMLMTIGAGVLLAYVMYRRLHMGGADCKAVMCLGLMYASQPLLFVLSIAYGCMAAVTMGLRWKNIPFIPPLTLGYAASATLFLIGGII